MDLQFEAVILREHPPLTWRFAYGLPPLIPKTPAACVLLSLRERIEVRVALENGDFRHGGQVSVSASSHAKLAITVWNFGRPEFVAA
jgi:hypothetical protein